MERIYSFAGANFKINSVFDYFGEFAKEYIVNDTYDYEINNTLEDIKKWANEHDDTEGFPLEYIETLVIHSKVASILSLNNKFIMHGSCIYLDNPNNAYIFTAPSGTGKSTHVNLLVKMFKERIHYINDDKPFIFDNNDKFEVYGSPWDGKERLSSNEKGTLKAIFVITRGNTNEAIKISPKEAVSLLVHQLHIPKGIKETTNATKALIDLSTKVDVYKLVVDISEDAPKASYKIMSK